MNRAPFLTADRLRGYPRLFLAVYAAIAVVWVCLSHNLIDPSGKPLGFDFITFWGASWLAQHGHAASIYDPVALWAAQRIAVPDTPQPYLWHYPPPFLLMVYPLASLPYVVALVIFLFVGFALYVATMRRIFPGAVWLIAAYPAVLLVALHGQATFLLVAVVAGGCMMLDRRPVLAGLILGLVVCKPHLALLFPVALIASGRWRTLGGMTASAIGLIVASALAFGLRPWRGFLADLPLARRVLEEGLLPWDTMPTVFAAARMQGASVRAAYAAQTVSALAIVASVALLWRGGEGDSRLKVAALVTGCLLISPYTFDYDLILLAFPIGLLAQWGVGRTGPWLVPLLGACVLTPILLPPIAKATSIQLMPLVLATLFGSVVFWHSERGSSVVTTALPLSPSEQTESGSGAVVPGTPRRDGPSGLRAEPWP